MSYVYLMCKQSGHISYYMCIHMSVCQHVYLCVFNYVYIIIYMYNLYISAVARPTRTMRTATVTR